ncbi:hypothetical protein SAMN06296065_102481 [Novosphingobium panipatense]|uniref:Uncharacterized protein n=1 Tax=Novosphingobium panipatense TaxID=428991 RepID=A0ABY1Q3S7_9SPHN|nr:hypothetical protein SAMN06296065_102481 [Novosphingobium panipatense]
MDARVTALRLESQARRLREHAEAIFLTKVFPTDIETSIGKILCSTSVLTPLDIIDDATAFEADARKLRALYA